MSTNEKRGDQQPPATRTEPPGNESTTETIELGFQLETLLAELSQRFLSTEDHGFDEAIRYGLRRAAAIGRADRSFHIGMPQNESDPVSFLEWCGPVVSSRSEFPSAQDRERFPAFATRLLKGEMVCVPVVAEMPDTFQHERDAMLAAGIRSYLLLPALAGDRLVGILGLHCVENERHWSEREIALLRLLADLFTGAVRRKRDDAALRRSEARFKALAENSRDSICEIGTDGEILYASPAYAELLGHTRAELEGRNFFDPVREEDREQLRRGIDDASCGNFRDTIAYRTQHRDGSWLDLETSAQGFSSAAGEARLVAVTRNVSERERNRRIVERQFEMEKRVAALSRAFVDIDPSAIGEAIRTRLADAAAIAGAEYSWMYSVGPESDSDRRLYEWVDASSEGERPAPPPARLSGLNWALPRLLAGEELNVARLGDLPPEAEVERAALQERGIRSLLGIPLLSQRRLIGFMGFETTTREQHWSKATVTLLRLVGEIFVSALRREQVAVELERSRGQLLQSQKMEAVGRLAGGIAHDFNNHLAVMLGNARYVLAEMEGRPELREALGDLQRSAEHCAQLTRSLLAFSRRSPVRVQVIEVADVMAGVAELVKPLLPSSIQFEVHPGEPDNFVEADPTQLRQVLVNLLVNARDAMPEGGKVVARARRRCIDSADASRLGLPRSGEYIELAVRDTGAGMCSETKSRIFEPFFTTKEMGKGTGLGLATAYGIVQQSLGGIEVESHPGAGTVFRVLLPRTADGPDEDPPSPDADPLPGSETLLIVEDEPALRRLVARSLRSAGYRVLEATDGIEGLEVAEHEYGQLDLLITDLVMPRMGGTELAAKLQATLPELRVLFLSGHAEPTAPPASAVARAARFLQKPFATDALLAEVRLLLEGT